MQRYGITIPLEGIPLGDQKEIFELAARLGYTDLWSAEAMGIDGVTPLALAGSWVPDIRLGTAILPAFTRGPALMAQTISGLASVAPGRVVVGIGTSSNVIVERFNGLTFEKPYQRVRDLVRFLKSALSGEKVTEQYETFSVGGFRLSPAPEVVPPILIAALRPGMLHLAARESEGSITNWLGVDDVKKVRAELGPEPELVARLFVCPTKDSATARLIGRHAIAAYLNVPVYAEFHKWLGNSEALTPMWNAWAAGDRKLALEKIPDSVVDSLIIHGSPGACKEHVARYVEAGIDTPVLAILPPVDQVEALRELAPNSP